MNIQEQKQTLRKWIKGQKALYDTDQKKEFSDRIFAKLEKDSRFLQAKTLMAYWSLPDEVHTHDFIRKWHQKKKILLPVIVGDDLEVREFRGEEQMRTGISLNIAEPLGETYKERDEIDMIIVPGMAFDRDGNRLGRGRAYYDRFLQSTRAWKLGICFRFQLVDKVPVSAGDIRMDEVLYD